MKLVKISEVKPNPKNPRIIKDGKFQKLVKSIQEFPDMLNKRPLVVFTDVDNKYVVLGGNMRLKACKEIGIKEIPIIIADEWTEEQKNEFLIKDNVGFGEWDWDSLANEWDAEKLDEWGLDVPDFAVTELEAEEDDYEIPNEIETDIVLGDLFEIGEHRLLCGDSTQVDTWQKVMNEKLCDMVMTDPPYNVDYSSKNKMLNYSDKGNRNQTDIENDKMDNNSFYQFLYDFYTALGSYTKKGGVWYVWHADSEGKNFRSAFTNSGLLLKQCLIWVKNNMVIGRQDYQWKHEPCLYGWKEGAAHYFTNDRTHTTVIEDKIDIKKLTKDEMKKMLTEMLSDKTKSTIINCDKPHRSAEHPTMKPILLLAPLIQNSSKENEIVADGFLGSGSTMVASHQLKRKCYGLELDPKYCQVIVDRMKKLDPSLVIKRNGEIIRD
jgi:site-specific DNA-methyltransferase (adenine-specific)